MFENNNFTEMCSVSGDGLCFRLIDFVYHSTLGLRVMKKDTCFWYASPRKSLREQEGVTTLSEEILSHRPGAASIAAEISQSETHNLR